MGKIVRDKRYINLIWCKCNDYDDYEQFAKNLWLYKDIEGSVLYDFYDENGKRISNDDRWFTDPYKWMSVFDIDSITGNDGVWEWELPVDPIKSDYVIKEKPEENEYPVIVQFSLSENLLTWISLNEFNNE